MSTLAGLRNVPSLVDDLLWFCDVNELLIARTRTIHQEIGDATVSTDADRVVAVEVPILHPSLISNTPVGNAVVVCHL